MNLKDLLTMKDSPPELYWALVIEKGLVQSGIWYIGDGKAEVVGIGAGIPWEGEEELIEATDAALSSAIQKLPENYSEPQKTVFGVSTSWVKDGEISPENLGKIKKLCTELTLTPVGFVVLPEAIAHLYKSEEGAPLNAIVLKSGVEMLELSVFKLGNLIGSTEVSRSVSLVDDVIEGLSRFEGASPLPTRFVIYDGKDGELEEVKQMLLQADWTGGKVSFLHTPQVEVLNTERKVLATALAGGAEIGNVTSVASVEDSEELGEEPTIEETQKPVEETGSTLQDFGFTVGQDISTMKNEDVENVIPVAPVPTPPIVRPQEPMFQQPAPQQPMNVPQQAPPTKAPIDYFSKSKSLFHSFSAKIFPKSGAVTLGKNKILNWILIGLGMAFLTIIILWGFLQTAKVSIFVTPKRAEENVQMIFNTDGTYDQATGLIPAKVVSSQVSGEKTKTTTGTKLIGDKATGSVQIANGNSASINLAAGTILTSSTGFKFTLNNEASVSGQLLPGSPGTSNVNVSAYDIGSQYNLAKGEVFSVGNYSKALVAATSTGDFSGGSSQEISAVGKDDQSMLEKELKDELSQNIKSELSAKVGEDEMLVSDLASLDVVSETFDHKVGDQASNLKLNLKLNATALVAGKDKLFEYSKSVLGGKAPAGYVLSSDQVDFRFTLVSAEDGKYTYNVVVGGNFLPDVNINKLKGIILGKTATAAQTYLNSIPGFDHADISLKIKFPGPLKTLPRISKNIVIEVRPE